MNWVRKGVRSAGRVALGAGLATGMVLVGCGTPGAPLPPSLNLADPVVDLAATRTGDQVELTWTMPKKNTDKLLLKGNVQVRVCRKEGTAGACAPAGDLAAAPGAEARFSETLTGGLAAGTPRALTYYVELRNRNGRSAGLSNGAVVVAGLAPGPVEGLEAEVRKAGVVLRWDAGAQEPGETAIRLHRKLLTPLPVKKNAGQNEATGERGFLAPPPEPVEQNLLVKMGERGADRALDSDIRFGATYEYRAQRVAQVMVNGKTLELDGPFTAPVRVEAADVFPPAVPTGLAAVAIAGENGGEPVIDLSWQSDTEADLAGYVVYRREGDGAWKRISPAEPVVGPGFSDTQVQAGHSYRYAVSAVDQGGRESGRSAEAEETVPGP